mgnify:CR=1 FL=1
MAKTSAEVEAEFIHTARHRTGRSIDEWMVFLRGTGLMEKADVFANLRNEFGLNFMQAKLLTGIFLNGGRPVYIKSKWKGK